MAWPEFLGSAATLFHASVSGFIVQAPREKRYAITTILGMDQKAIGLYNDYYCITDPWHLGLRERQLVQWIGAGSSLCSPLQLASTEFYNDYWKYSASTVYQAGIIFKSSGSSVVFTMHRDRNQRDFGAQDLRLLRRLYPHLRRAVSVHHTVASLHQSLINAGGVVNALDVGLIGLDAGRNVCFTNQIADDLLRKADVLAMRDGKLTTCSSSGTDALSRLIETAFHRVLDALPGGSITVGNEMRSLHLTVLPMTGSHREIIPDQKVFLTITEPAAQPRRREQLLVELFRLTPSEARVVMLLLAGLDPAEIADRTCTTPSTVRFQLKMVYRKMGVSRQSQLVRLAARLPGRE